MPDRLRNKKSDKAKRNFELNGKYSAKSIRLFELAQESRGAPTTNTEATTNANANTNTNPFKAVDFDPALANTDFEPAYNITGKFFVAVQRGPCPPGPSCQIVTLRSLGTNSTGNRKLIEVVVTMGNK